MYLLLQRQKHLVHQTKNIWREGEGKDESLSLRIVTFSVWRRLRITQGLFIQPKKVLLVRSSMV